MLVSVTGPRDMKLRLQGLPRPLLLKLHRESTFTDMEYLAGQVFRFTAMSWRRPYPSREPVTILYSDLIAGLLGHLRHVKNWNSDIVSSPASATRGGSCDRTARRRPPRPRPTRARGSQRRHSGSPRTTPRAASTRCSPATSSAAPPCPALARTVGRLSAAWLEENHDRLRQTPVVAAIGYGLAGALPGAQARSPGACSSPGLRRLMSRNPFADRLTFVYDLPQLVGIGLAAQAVAADLPGFSEWLSADPADDRLQPSDRFQALLRAHVRALLDRPDGSRARAAGRRRIRHRPALLDGKRRNRAPARPR